MTTCVTLNYIHELPNLTPLTIYHKINLKISLRQGCDMFEFEVLVHIHGLVRAHDCVADSKSKLRRARAAV